MDHGIVAGMVQADEDYCRGPVRERCRKTAIRLNASEGSTFYITRGSSNVCSLYAEVECDLFLQRRRPVFEPSLELIESICLTSRTLDSNSIPTHDHLCPCGY